MTSNKSIKCLDQEEPNSAGREPVEQMDLFDGNLPSNSFLPWIDSEDDPFHRHIKYSQERPDNEVDLFASDSDPVHDTVDSASTRKQFIEDEDDEKAMDTEEQPPNLLSLASSFCRYKEQRIGVDMFDLEEKFDGDRPLEFSEDKFTKFSDAAQVDDYRHLLVDHAWDENLHVEDEQRTSEDDRLMAFQKKNYLQFLSSIPKTCSPSICGILSNGNVSFPESVIDENVDRAPFDWSIDQLATLKPAEISFNERVLQRYAAFEGEPSTQERLNKDSELFFSQERIARSPSTPNEKQLEQVDFSRNEIHSAVMQSPITHRTPSSIKRTARQDQAMGFHSPILQHTSTPCINTRTLPPFTRMANDSWCELNNSAVLSPMTARENPTREVYGTPKGSRKKLRTSSLLQLSFSDSEEENEMPRSSAPETSDLGSQALSLSSSNFTENTQDENSGQGDRITFAHSVSLDCIRNPADLFIDSGCFSLNKKRNLNASFTHKLSDYPVQNKLPRSTFMGAVSSTTFH